jgi:hypothetical protein
MQIARELRLRDIGGIIVVDFIDMTDDSKISTCRINYSVKWFSSYLHFIMPYAPLCLQLACLFF